jgi:PAS domain S-box-containing protein
VLDALPVPIFFKDAQGIYRGCNRAFESYLGRRREEIVGRTVEGLSPPDLARVYRAADERLLASREPQIYEARVQWADGTLRDVVFSKGVFLDEAGAAAGLAGSILDVTERKKAEQAQAERLQLADRLAAVGALAAGVAHEINNPLASLTANLQFALGSLSGMAQAEVVEALGEAAEAARRVARIVSDLRGFSRVDEELGPVDLSGVIQSTANLARPLVARRGDLTVEAAEPVRVRANGPRLGQVFLNLVVNAAQALPDRPREQNQVRISSRLEGEWAVVEVRDNGVGIPPAIRRRIFDPFFTTKPAGEGTGLGLSISHSIVAAAGGSIELESEVGAGSLFRVRLPASRGRI